MICAFPAFHRSMKAVWVIADLHLLHTNILTFGDRHDRLVRPGYASVDFDELIAAREIVCGTSKTPRRKSGLSRAGRVTGGTG